MVSVRQALALLFRATVQLALFGPAQPHARLSQFRSLHNIVELHTSSPALAVGLLRFRMTFVVAPRFHRR